MDYSLLIYALMWTAVALYGCGLFICLIKTDHKEANRHARAFAAGGIALDTLMFATMAITRNFP